MALQSVTDTLSVVASAASETLSDVLAMTGGEKPELDVANMRVMKRPALEQLLASALRIEEFEPSFAPEHEILSDDIVELLPLLEAHAECVSIVLSGHDIGHRALLLCRPRQPPAPRPGGQE